ncbi:MAG: toprim domain-containing protein [Clostridiales bacterium]|nr:toprim domain-containing protein [Clostridiales bacterium]
MNIDADKIREAKEKLGDRNAEIMASLLNLKDYDEKNKKACSPYRNEKTPSFIYDSQTYRFHDFGGEGITVDLIDVLMQQGHTYLQACKKLFEYAGIEYAFGEEGVKTRHQYKYPEETPINAKEKVYEYLGKRGISRDTVDYLDIREDDHGNCVLNYYDTNDVLTMKKLRPARTINKEKKEPKCWCEKGCDTTPLLFNMNRINTSQPLLITEGEFDAASAIEAGYFNTVSIPLGAGNFSWIEENFDFLEQFDSIILASDNDKAGEKMRKECIYRLGSWRTKYIEYPEFKELSGGRRIPIKDMNDTLQAFGAGYVMSMIINAKDTPVDSVVDFADVEDIDISTIDGIETGIQEFDQEMMRLFYGSFNIVTGTNGSGKSSFLGQLTCNSIEQGKDVWMYSKELPNYMTKNWIDSIFAGVRNVDEHTNNTGSKYYTIRRDVKKRIDEYYRGHFKLYKDEWGNTLDDIKKSMEDCVRKYGCKLFIIDNLTAINFDCTDNEKWSKQVDLVNYCIQFAQKFHVTVILVIHPKKIETYRRLTKFDVQGLGSIVDLAHRLISLYRVQKKEKEDPQNPIKYDVICDILKDRLRGKEGLEVGMYYSDASRRFYTNKKEYDRQYSWDTTTYETAVEYPHEDDNAFS